MRKDRAAYDEMYELIRPVVRHKTVLELATGTGLIAKHIVNAAAHIEATDASAEMIAEAKRDNRSAKLHFSVQDMFRLPGIFRTVALYSVPKVYVRDLVAIPDLDVTYTDGSLAISADVCNLDKKVAKGYNWNMRCMPMSCIRMKTSKWKMCLFRQRWMW